jgi:hypothetical protein
MAGTYTLVIIYKIRPKRVNQSIKSNIGTVGSYLYVHTELVLTDVRAHSQNFGAVLTFTRAKKAAVNND